MWEGSLDRFQRMKRDRIANILYELYERDGEAEDIDEETETETEASPSLSTDEAASHPAHQRQP